MADKPGRAALHYQVARTLRETTVVGHELSSFQNLAPIKVLLDRLADVAV